MTALRLESARKTESSPASDTDNDRKKVSGAMRRLKECPRLGRASLYRHRRIAFSAERETDRPSSAKIRMLCAQKGVVPSLEMLPRMSSSVVGRAAAVSGTGPSADTEMPRAERVSVMASPACMVQRISHGMRRGAGLPERTSFSARRVASLSASVRMPRISQPVTPRK